MNIIDDETWERLTAKFAAEPEKEPPAPREEPLGASEEPAEAQIAQTVRGRPFAKGTSGNPDGRPPGARNKATRLAQSLLEQRTKSVIDLLLDKALEGNMIALKLCVERILPRPRHASVELDLPGIENINACSEAVATLIAAAAAGELTLPEAKAMAKLVDIRRRCADTEEFALQIKAFREELDREKRYG